MFGLGLGAIRLTVCVLIFALFGSVFSPSLFKALECHLEARVRLASTTTTHRGRFVGCSWETVEACGCSLQSIRNCSYMNQTHSNWHYT